MTLFVFHFQYGIVRGALHLKFKNPVIAKRRAINYLRRFHPAARIVNLTQEELTDG